MLHAVAGKDLDVAIVHLHGHRHGELPFGMAQDGVNARIEVDVPRNLVELGQDGAPEILIQRPGGDDTGNARHVHVDNLLGHFPLLKVSSQ